MRRARGDGSFTWEPFDHGRQRRIAALVAVGLCAGVVGLVVGRVSSGGIVEGGRAPPPSAVTTKKDQAALATPASPPVVLANPATEQQISRNSNKQIPSRTSEPTPLPVHPERQTSPASVPAVGKQNDQALPPNSPPVVLLNPGAADVGDRTVSEQAPERQNSPASTAKGEKRNAQEIPPVQTAPRVVQRPVPSSISEENTPRGRQQNRGYQSNLPDANPSPKSRNFKSERPGTFADYGALREYMMRR